MVLDTNRITKGTRDNTAMALFSAPVPNQTGFPSLSTRVTWPHNRSRPKEPASFALALSPLIQYLPLFMPTILWTTSFPVSGSMTPTTSPFCGKAVEQGDRVMISLSLINGDMLQPRALNLNGFPLSTTAVRSFAAAAPESESSFPVREKYTDALQRFFNKKLPFQKFCDQSQDIRLDLLKRCVILVRKSINQIP